MQCTSPNKYTPEGMFITTTPPCGNCLSCKLNDRAVWASRLVCERKAYDTAQFITLTYRDEDLPTGPQEAKESFQKFIKRYRTNTGTQPRYYACMEYGSRFGRLHWHAIFFGTSPLWDRRRKNNHLIVVDPRIEDNWQNGSTYTKDCNYATQGLNITQYVAAYILKNKWKSKQEIFDAPKLELALQSRSPYIGKPVVNLISELCTTKKGSIRCAALGTVPDRLKMAGRFYRLYSRIRKDVAENIGYPYEPVPWNDGTLIDIDGNSILKLANHVPKTKHQAVCHELSIKSKINRNRSKNRSANTG